MTKLPGVIESGMSGKNGQRKLGTTRGSPSLDFSNEGNASGLRI
jgi:hypothetical protein